MVANARLNPDMLTIMAVAIHASLVATLIARQYSVGYQAAPASNQIAFDAHAKFLETAIAVSNDPKASSTTSASQKLSNASLGQLRGWKRWIDSGMTINSTHHNITPSAWQTR
jgi:hypothetical protein